MVCFYNFTGMIIRSFSLCSTKLKANSDSHPFIIIVKKISPSGLKRRNGHLFIVLLLQSGTTEHGISRVRVTLLAHGNVFSCIFWRDISLSCFFWTTSLCRVGHSSHSHTLIMFFSVCIKFPISLFLIIRLHRIFP